jgi:hypothetical protein
MGGSLELGKVTAAVWLKNNWHRASLQFKLYLLPAVTLLMFITSMGIFGFLSKAHNDQNLVSGDVQSKISIYDEKIKTAKENIEADRKQIKQMDDAVDQVMARSTTEGGADKSNTIRRSQARDRASLAKDIEANQKIISQLNDQAAPIRAEVRKVEAEVGPIKYIAKLIYGDNPDANILEKAVVWVIITIVAVFDPLALVLILAAQQSIRWAHGEELEEDETTEPEEESFAEKLLQQGVANTQPEDNMPLGEMRPMDAVEQKAAQDAFIEEYFIDEPVFDREEVPLEELPVEEKQKFAGFGWPMTSLFNTPKQDPVVEEEIIVKEPELVTPPVVENTTIGTVGDDYIEINGKRMHHKVFDPNSDHAAHAVERHIEKNQLALEETSAPPGGDGNLWINQDNGWVNAGPMNQFDLGLTADNAPPTASGEMRGFGSSFPDTAAKGDMFLRVDQLPSALYKFNGSSWIEVDKALSDQHAYDDAYIDHLIEKISTGEYDPELLSNAERDSIEQRLNTNPRQA